MDTVDAHLDGRGLWIPGQARDDASAAGWRVSGRDDGSARAQAGDGPVDQRLVGGGVELGADQDLGGGGGGSGGLGADLVEGGALGGGDLVLGHPGAALDQGGG